MPLKQHPTDPEKVVYARREYDLPAKQEPVSWVDEIIEDLHACYNTEMIKENDSGDALIRLDAAIACVEEAAIKAAKAIRARGHA